MLLAAVVPTHMIIAQTKKADIKTSGRIFMVAFSLALVVG
jgi:hypothetical protein